MLRKGVDISEYQPSANFVQMKQSGVEFVILRAGYGSTGVDASFERHYSSAVSARMPKGVYWYSYASNTSQATAEADKCLKQIRGKQFQYPIYYDVESEDNKRAGKSTLTSCVITFCNKIQNAGYVPGIYCSLSFLQDYLIPSQLIGHYTLWIACWSSTKPKTSYTYDMWQKSESGKVNGINGSVDLDDCYFDFPTKIQQLKCNGYGSGKWNMKMNTSSTASSPTYIWPTPDLKTITSPFGPRTAPYSGYHYGIDISGSSAYGKPILAAADGTVDSTWTCNIQDPNCNLSGMDSYGIFACIKHTDSISTAYAHMSKRVVQTGDKVKQGQVIGYVGTTGSSTGAHLHFEVRLNGNRVDPQKYVDPSNTKYAQQSTTVIDSYLEGNDAYEVALRGGFVPDVESFKQYVMTIDRNSPDINYKKMKEADVFGVLIEGGYLFNSLHQQVEFKNPKLNRQIDAAKDAEFPFGLYFATLARNLDDAAQEMSNISLLVRSYPPQLGVWIQPKFDNSKTTNNRIIEYYKNYMTKYLGLQNQIGIYATKEELSRFTWKDYCEEFYLWLDSHVDDLDGLDELLTPAFFML